MRERITTGVDGLDDMMGGGVPKGNQVLLAGGPGTGKTLFTFAFVYKNAQLGRPGIIISLEENAEDIVENAKSAFPEFTGIDDMLRSGEITIYDAKKLMTALFGNPDMTRLELAERFFKSVSTQVAPIIKEAHAQTIVIDNMTILRIFFKDDWEYRNFAVSLHDSLKEAGVTGIIISELSSPQRSKLTFEQEFFEVDGIIMLYLREGSGEGADTRVRTIEVLEMRGTSHSLRTMPYEVTPHGLCISR